MKVIFLVFTTLSLALAQVEKPTEPTKCSAENQGRCECGNESQGITTYTFWLADQQRCFHVFFPLERKGEVLPVAVHSSCYSKNKLTGAQSNSPTRPENIAAARYGFAKIGISTPNGNWDFGRNSIHDNVINDEHPLPCSDEDSIDLAYIRKILQWVETNPELDATRMWAWGFSQNSVFSQLIGYCFPDNFAGVFQGASALRLTGQKPYGVGCDGQVRNSDWETCKAEKIKRCDQCAEKYPCDECKYWPNYPCYNPVRPMIGCLTEYENDKNAVDKQSGNSAGLNMYDALIREGHDGRLLRFGPNGDIKGNPDMFKILSKYF